MKISTSIILLLTGLTALAAAEIPRKAPISRYTRLWTDSPFTTKPPPVDPQDVANPLNDYILAGIAPIVNGYRVTILSRKNPQDRLTFDSTNPNSDYKVISVKQNPGDLMGTEVRLSTGSVTGTVKFEKELLVPVAAAPVQQPNQQQLPPGVNPQPNQQTQDDGNRRQPRPRVIPPPQNGNNANAAGGNNRNAQPQRPNRR